LNDKMRLFKLYSSHEKNNFHLLIQRQFMVNALFINNIIRKF
jgi:hypothetical protein